MPIKKYVFPGCLTLLLFFTIMVVPSGGNLEDKTGGDAGKTLLNVSYDPTRELYREYNVEFSRRWESLHDYPVTVRQSHAASGKQARAVIDGLDADVVTLAVSIDIDAIAANSGFIAPDWQTRFPDNSSPYTTIQVFLVRKGNPLGIRDWDDLVRPGIEVITPNPKTSGGARWNFLAAYGHALLTSGGDHRVAEDFVGKLFANVPVLDTGARGATNTFVRNGIGDVLITYENEALLAQKELGREFEIVVPPRTILVETPVAVVDAVVDRHDTRELSIAYIGGLYEDWGQRIAASNFYRPRNSVILQEYSRQFPAVDTFTVEEVFGSWRDAQKRYFDDGGVFDRLYEGVN